MSDCNHNCEGCAQSCGSRTAPSAIPIEQLHELSSVKKTIGIVSGKGGVGKSIVTGMLATLMRRRGRSVGIMDADMTGPSIPQEFGVNVMADTTEDAIYPVQTKTGISVISVNNLLPDRKDPVIWRGPVVAGLVKQFWSQVIWNDIDYLFIDMPPGTSDVPLTVFQSIPIDGIIVVGTPQELVGMIVEKAVRMAREMNIPLLGFIENMRSVICPDCKKEIFLYGESHMAEIAKQYGAPLLSSLPMDPALTKVVDKGLLELFEGDYLTEAADLLDKMLPIE